MYMYIFVYTQVTSMSSNTLTLSIISNDPSLDDLYMSYNNKSQ